MKNAYGVSFFILNHKIFFKVNIGAILFSESEFIIHFYYPLTFGLSSISANVSGKVKSHMPWNVCTHVNPWKLVLCMSYHKCWFVKNNI